MQLVGDLGEARLAAQLLERDAVNFVRALVDVAIGIEVVMERAAGRPAVHHFDAADFDDPVTQLGLEAGGFGVEDDLAAWRASLLGAGWRARAAPASIASIASLASWSTRSLPSTPEWPRTQCHSRSCCSTQARRDAPTDPDS